jgi:biofilm PGA synthesis N-glycosyltransferase PgaC
MTKRPLTYAVVTPARSEASSLPRLAECLIEQTVTPRTWVIVDNGSTDETLELARELASRHAWIEVLSLPPNGGLQRGGPIVKAFETGVQALPATPDVVVKLDADISMEADYFERLLAELAAEQSLGIASGSGFEQERNGTWRRKHVGDTNVWGACRAYRWQCLQDVLPLEKRMGWDGIDEIKAQLHGWSTKTLLDLRFRHHRSEGERDGSRLKPWIAFGDVSHYMGYRPWFVVLRAAYWVRRDPAAVAMIAGYFRALVRREPQCADEEVRAHLRRRQSLRRIPELLRHAQHSKRRSDDSALAA